MTGKLNYKLAIGVNDGANVEEIEELLQELLKELYEQGEIESIRVTKDGHVQDSETDDIPELIELIEDLNSSDIKRAIDSVKELEDLDDDG